MTIITLGVVVTIATAGATAPVVAGAISGGATGAATAIVGGATGTAAAVAGSAAAGGAAGAIGGAVAGGAGLSAMTGAGIGAATGAGSAAAITSASAGAAGIASGGAATASVLAGPVGWLILGTEGTQLSATYTFDCWKAVLHDQSSEPSNGRLLKDVIMDSRIKQVTTTQTDESTFPELILQNIWDEEFRIEYVLLPYNQWTAHAVKM